MGMHPGQLHNHIKSQLKDVNLDEKWKICAIGAKKRKLQYFACIFLHLCLKIVRRVSVPPPCKSLPFDFHNLWRQQKDGHRGRLKLAVLSLPSKTTQNKTLIESQLFTDMVGRLKFLFSQLQCLANLYFLKITKSKVIHTLWSQFHTFIFIFFLFTRETGTKSFLYSNHKKQTIGKLLYKYSVFSYLEKN